MGASACDPTKWCAALNVFSLLEDPVNGTVQNATCAAKVGIETFQFAFVTRNGRSQAPANPLASTLTTFTPDPEKDLFMNSGDRLKVSFADTAHGLRVVVDDLTAGESGSMTASAASGRLMRPPLESACCLARLPAPENVPATFAACRIL